MTKHQTDSQTIRQTIASQSPDRDPASDIRLAITRTARKMRQQADADLSPTHLAALATVERHGPLTPSRLAEIEGIKRPTATRTVGCLDEKGLIEGTVDPDDRRSTLLEITDRGRGYLAEVRSRKSAWIAQLLEELPGEDAETLRRAADILARALEEEHG